MTRPLPHWPRLLNADLASSYVSESKSQFLADVGTIWPEPWRKGKLRLWDRNKLDAAVDGLEQHSSDGDPFLRALG